MPCDLQAMKLLPGLVHRSGWLEHPVGTSDPRRSANGKNPFTEEGHLLLGDQTGARELRAKRKSEYGEVLGLRREGEVKDKNKS